ncbi:4-hydroxy-tetrahydrodipicolinate reductase [Telmatocola sphagniphila]|jgi:4-hydroxy-tetrahydrodipicolinate reductase|uniref:4-hydroxy-tetrahydrodipicolinate reductase n=1 Tax=Telmatocola sphagniphila TaxID=1123043 RepID=A0A8E6EW47_9BACT|nr:4-hydroxy-tetrahydrodipicolinate reductase [Telmatocola sphagniphila]QVL33610.1 4-hydroxy-tetrahydrodipicolinate reductase [Telmatocola sphagniphila]
MSKIRYAMNGACGRMGQRIIALGHEDHGLSLVAALDSGKHPAFGKDAGELAGVGKLEIPITSELPFDQHPEVVIDFSTPEGSMEILKTCVARKIPLVVATTGHSAEQKREIEAAAHATALLLSPSMSLVVNLLFKLVQQASQALMGKGFDVEIIERHHRMKKDSPSGTAMQFARIIQETMGQSKIVHGREGIVGERPLDEIGMHAIRGGDNVGEHTIMFSALGETMELIHKGYSRDSYARGALLAAKFLAGKPAGRYTMYDVLGL